MVDWHASCGGSAMRLKDAIAHQPRSEDYMYACPAICIAVAVSFSGTLYAQGCSGGAQGGTDATGNQCNSSAVQEANLPALAVAKMTGTQRSLTTAPTPAAFTKVLLTVGAVAMAPQPQHRLPATPGKAVVGTAMTSKSAGTEAGSCSGGIDGGTDATGNQCNDPDHARSRLAAMR